MVEHRLDASRPLEKVVDAALQAPVARVAARGAVAEGAAEQRHPRRGQASRPRSDARFAVAGRPAAKTQKYNINTN